MNHRQLLKRIISEDGVVASPIPGEAPSQVSDQPVITEPTNNPSTEDLPSLYDLYPDLANVDVSSACTLADFFASMCETEQVQKDQELVPSASAVGTPEEF